MVRTQIQLKEEQADALKRLSEERHVSMAELIRIAVDDAIKSTYVLDNREKWERACRVVGKYRSGKQDISLHHDKYLAEAFGR